MNPNLDHLQTYPFQKLRELFAGITPNPQCSPIDLSIGEPRHATPDLIKTALIEHFDGLSNYPSTLGLPQLRESISAWLARRYPIPALDATQQILPVNGSREALFSFAQAVIDTTANKPPVVIAPNPFYQIYEGAALLAGATPWYLPTLPEHNFRMRFEDVPDDVLQATQLVYVCSPGNPTGHVMNLDEWRKLFDLSDRYGFIIAADECYSEIYFDETHPPLGALEAAHQLGRHDYAKLVVFGSLSKRSNVPGMRSGFVAGDAALIQKFLLYRTYHGSAMSPTVQMASARAWDDEIHVQENRLLYKKKFAATLPILQTLLPSGAPDAAFYLWLKVPGDDTVFARELYRQHHVTVLPGSYLARNFGGFNPGYGYVRVALVAPLAACIEAANKIIILYQQVNNQT
ncbi:MAG: succinyldiaminopimelate transaminase [Betaproteobacteria bacterium]|nr:succinyldiaminopimelate transaminase [Betaproteobacteria bacterium]